MVKPGATGFKRVMNAIGYSLLGLKACWRFEAGFRQEAIACLFLFPAAFYFGDNGIEIALLLGSCVLVLLMEIVNSALEAVVDRIGSEHHELAGRAKDMGSAAVFISIMSLVMTWVLVLFWD